AFRKAIVLTGGTVGVQAAVGIRVQIFLRIPIVGFHFPSFRFISSTQEEKIIPLKAAALHLRMKIRVVNEADYISPRVFHFSDNDSFADLRWGLPFNGTPGQKAVVSFLNIANTPIRYDAFFLAG